MQQELDGKLSGIEKLSDIEDIASYTKQYFTIGRQAHVRSTQSFGTPALVWHVAFWPKRGKDPQDLDDKAARAPLTRNEARDTYNQLRDEIRTDINKLLGKLQDRGRVPKKEQGRHRDEIFEKPARPPDWVAGSSQSPVDAYITEHLAFTIWWSDEARDACPSEPPAEDLRVRVQADIHPDFASLTFIVDAGKPWNRPAHLVDGQADDAVPGDRRRRIFAAARAIKKHAAGRLAQDPTGAADVFPESGVSDVDARELLAASNLFYEDVWREFCDTFDFRLADIAGDTDKVFANFRGVVLAASDNRQKERSHLSRFVYGSRNGRSSLDEDYPNAVVKAYWPFIRRTRSEADYRDWIACGVFDWRALYITALGGQSEFDPGDEGRSATEIPAGHLRPPALSAEGPIDTRAVQRQLEELLAVSPGDLGTRTRIERLKDGLAFPHTPQGDLPAPFHYLFLTSGEPDRRQIGRMVDRVNLLGTVRLYAMKNFSIIRDADVHLRIYGQLLDQIMRRGTEATGEALQKWWLDAYQDAERNLKALWAQEREPEIGAHAKLSDLRSKYCECLGRFEDELRTLATRNEVTEEPLMLYRRLLADMIDAAPEDTEFGPKASNLFATARRHLDDARKAKSRHDEDMAQLNRQTDLRLHKLKTHIDDLGRDAIGGLSFRINRARYYADTYRRMVNTLRVGSIDTWWDYEQLASRGVDPPLRFIEDVGARLEKLRIRLRDAMDAVQTSAIANQTEATRDNTFQLEVIARGIRDVNVRLSDLQARLLVRQFWVSVVATLVGLLIAAAGVYFGNSVEISLPGLGR